MTKALITGPTGCIGVSTVEYLIDRGVAEIVGVSRKTDAKRLSEKAASRTRLVKGDVSDEARMREIVLEEKPTHVIHLAAFQTPDCQAHPFRGMDINVGGTMHLLKAVAELGDHVQRMVVASSSAVYGPRSMYPGETVTPADPYFPPNLYGFWKTANEGMAQAYHLETGVPTICHRLSTTYGPGRDLGLSSAPTYAMKALVLGQNYAIPYNGREHYHYVSDVGAGFGGCLIDPFTGYGVFNLRGRSILTSDFAAAANEVALEMGLEAGVSIASDPDPYPFVCDLDESDILEKFPNMPLTDLQDGIYQALEHFIDERDAGRLTAADLG